MALVTDFHGNSVLPPTRHQDLAQGILLDCTSWAHKMVSKKYSYAMSINLVNKFGILESLKANNMGDKIILSIIFAFRCAVLACEIDTFIFNQIKVKVMVGVDDDGQPCITFILPSEV